MGVACFLVTRTVQRPIIRPIIPITVPTISAVLKLLLPLDEFEEPVPVAEGGKLDVGDFFVRENDVRGDRVVDPEGKAVVVVLDAVESGDGITEADVVLEVSAVLDCYSVPVRTKRWRVNTVLKLPNLVQSSTEMIPSGAPQFAPWFKGMQITSKMEYSELEAAIW